MAVEVHLRPDQPLRGKKPNSRFTACIICLIFKILVSSKHYLLAQFLNANLANEMANFTKA